MARPIWSGSISFGLVSVPVRMYSATQSKELRFHFLDRRDLQPIGYDKVRRDTGESVEPENVIRGFEVDVGIA
jgi:DNA end-binding protein Ku